VGRGIRVVAALAAVLAFAPSASALTDFSPRPGAEALVFAWPADGTITTVFGHTEGRWHPGIDIGSLRDLTVRAAFPGVVEAVGAEPGFEGYGYIVLVRVKSDVETLYAHLASWDVKVGDLVGADQQLGVAGCTGWCTGTHLHFEVRRSGLAVDPMQFLG
jgi:murein DD-endopeptidase MepM/ murein hydrolase activator NlpD